MGDGQRDGRRSVLIVEDQPLDAVLLRRAIAARVPAVVIEALADGLTALERLRDLARPRPDLVVLDLNLPGPSGHELLSEMRATDGLRATPCVVLTSSKTDEDRERSLALGATAHVVKPSSLEGYATLAATLAGYLTAV